MCAYVCMCLVTQLYTTLSTLWTVAHQTRLSMGILQARMLEGVAFPFSRGIFPTQGSNPGLCIAGRFFTPEPPGKSIQ